ncbi:MAG: histidine kinase dimerization/phospho-acceptor domain-containing protein [Pseudobdellovibrionaceae bacterium]
MLIIGHPSPSLVHFGADFVSDLNEGMDRFKNHAYQVVMIPFDHNNETALRLAQDIVETRSATQIVAVAQNLEPRELLKITRQNRLFKILNTYSDPFFEDCLRQALEESALIEQNNQMAQLTSDLNLKLKGLYSELEDRIDKRSRFLSESRRKLLVTNRNIELLREAFIAVHRASSIGEMETLLNEALKDSLELSWTRIFFQPHDQIFAKQNTVQLSFAIHACPLFRDQEQLGTIFFLRVREFPFSKAEVDFLSRIGEAVALSIDRLAKIEQSENLQRQWDATFNAISDPVSIIDANYTIVQTNRNFLTKTATLSEQVIGSKCHEVLFARKSPCDNCKLGTQFKLQNPHKKRKSTEVLDVFSQKFKLKPEDPSLYVNMYHDISEQVQMEAQILESAKLAELGVIGSSIAHELNNPLGGILNFLQLIQMEMDKKDTHYQDIHEMELGAQRCKEIVQNLLGFSRTSAVDTKKDLDLKDVIHRSLKILELQTRSRGIEIRLHLPEEPLKTDGHLNLLSQALKNILQRAVDSISEKMSHKSGFIGLIEVRAEKTDTEFRIDIIDNGGDLPSGASSGIGISVANQIIHEHSGKLEISSQTLAGSIAKIHLPRPDFRS